MFWTIVAAILFVMFLPYIFAVVLWIAGAIIAIAGYILAAVVALALANGAWELLKTLGLASREVDWTSGTVLLWVTIPLAIYLIFMFLKLEKISFPGLLVPQLRRAFKCLEPYELGRYVRHHYTVTVGDAEKIAKLEKDKEWLAKFEIHEESARQMAAQQKEIWKNDLRQQLLDQLPAKDQKLRDDIEKRFKKFVSSDLIQITDGSCESMLLLAQDRSILERDNDLSDKLVVIKPKRTKSWLAKVSIKDRHIVQIYSEMDQPSESYVLRFQDLSANSWENGLEYLEERVVDDLYKSVEDERN